MNECRADRLRTSSQCYNSGLWWKMCFPKYQPSFWIFLWWNNSFQEEKKNLVAFMVVFYKSWSKSLVDKCWEIEFCCAEISICYWQPRAKTSAKRCFSQKQKTYHFDSVSLPLRLSPCSLIKNKKASVCVIYTVVSLCGWWKPLSLL